MDGQSTARALPVAVGESPAERLTSLVDSHYDRLYRLARRLAPSTDDALDLVQETFLKVARSPKSIPVGVRNEEAWLVRVLINIRRDQWRRASTRDRHDRDSVGDGSLVSHGRDPETALIARTTVWQALDCLPTRRRAIVIMYELDGLDIPAIASLLGISAITVRWHLSKGRRELTRVLRSYMGDNDEED